MNASSQIILKGLISSITMEFYSIGLLKQNFVQGPQKRRISLAHTSKEVSGHRCVVLTGWFYLHTWRSGLQSCIHIRVQERVNLQSTQNQTTQNTLMISWAETAGKELQVTVSLVASSSVETYGSVWVYRRSGEVGGAGTRTSAGSTAEMVPGLVLVPELRCYQDWCCFQEWHGTRVNAGSRVQIVPGPLLVPGLSWYRGWWWYWDQSWYWG